MKDLIPNDLDQPDAAPNEVKFALIISSMIETVKNNPENLRQAVYDLARYKLREQFTYADAKNVKRTLEALEGAIRGVEEFSQEQIKIPSPSAVLPLNDLPAAPRSIQSQELAPPDWLLPHAKTVTATYSVTKPAHPLLALIMRTAAMLVIIGGVLLAVQQRERLADLVGYVPRYERQPAVAVQRPPPREAETAAAILPKPKRNPLQPTDYGVYAVSGDSLTELQLLPGRPPDIRVAVSAALKMPSQTVLPNGHPKFIVFRRDAATSVAERAEIRIVAKVAREFSAEAAGKKLDDSDTTWVIRNVAFPFRSAPMPDSPEMYELHSEDPALELTPGRYALILKSQAYDFTVEGKPVDARQCIERVVVTTGTLYVDCKKL